MGEHFEYDVFLSHSAKDKPEVRPIAERLRADGIKVWFDEWELRPGDHIHAKIEDALEHSRVLVLCMSANAFGSDWTQLESGVFRFRDPLNKGRRFIPLRLDDAPLKGSLAPLLFVDWRAAARDREYPKLLESCRQPSAKQTSVEQSRPQFEEKVISLGHTEPVRSVAWSPDGRHALSGADDNTVRIWDVETGGYIRLLEGHYDSALKRFSR